VQNAIQADPGVGRPRVILRSKVLQEGMNSDHVQAKRRRREWISLRPGAYVEADVLPTLNLVDRHLQLIEATVPLVDESAIISHSSAACLLGVELWQPNLRAVQMTRPGASSGHRRTSLHTFRAEVDEEEIVVLGGYRTTSAARTIIDLARHLPFELAVVAADSALRTGLTSIDLLVDAAERARRRPGTRQAHLVIKFADARSESVGESRSRVLISRAGLPEPELQFVVPNHLGIALGRADFGWPELRTVGEFDGAGKYGRLLSPGVRPGDAVFMEKVREDEIRDAGWQVARWTAEDLKDPHAVASRIRRAFERGRRSI